MIVTKIEHATMKKISSPSRGISITGFYIVQQFKVYLFTYRNRHIILYAIFDGAKSFEFVAILQFRIDTSVDNLVELFAIFRHVPVANEIEIHLKQRETKLT